MSDLDPARVTHAWQHALVRVVDTRHVLAADDAHAREVGLVCTGDELTLDMLRDIFESLASASTLAWSSHMAVLPAALRARLEGGEQRG